MKQLLLHTKGSTGKGRHGSRNDGSSKKKSKRNTLELKNTITEIMNVSDGLINRFNKAKERISELEYRSVETSQIAVQREK